MSPARHLATLGDQLQRLDADDGLTLPEFLELVRMLTDNHVAYGNRILPLPRAARLRQEMEEYRARHPRTPTP